MEALTIMSALILLGYLFWERRKRVLWQARYDAVEQRAIEIARSRNHLLALR